MSEASDQTQSIPVFPGYIVVDTIGVGGMGAVYEAEKENVTYALKTILSDNISERALVRFQREALAAASVDKHPNIVSVHKLELDAEPPFIVMDFVEGEALDQFIKEGEPWTLEQVIELLKPLASALDHMHSKGIIHRDLKPANILIRNHDGAPMITDFGIAREVSLNTLTKTGEILGTPEYMAPEQLDDAKNACPQTDLWSLAVMTYELLTGGRTPFHATSLFQLAEDLLCKPPDLSALDPEQPHILEVLEFAFNKDPALRFASCSEFVEALGAKPIPSSTSYYRIPLFVFILLLIALAFYWNKRAPTRQASRSYKQEYQSLKKEVHQIQTELLPEHFYQHLIKAPDRKNKDCVASKRLYHRVIRLKNEMTQLGLSKEKVAKRTNRWDDFMSFVEIVEEVDPSAAIVNANTDIQRQLRAFQLYTNKSPKAAEWLKFAPELPAWRKSWLLLRIKIATEQKLYAQSLDYLEKMRKEFPKETRFEGDLWLARAKAAEARGNSDKVERYKALFAYWRYQQLKPGFEIPKLFHFGLDRDGQLDVLKINRALDKLRFQNPKFVFQVTIQAANHGIYLDSLDSYGARGRLTDFGFPEQLVQQEPNNPAALFWRAYAPLLSSRNVPKDKLRGHLLEIRKKLDVAIESSQPSFYHAILHSHRANLLCELAATFPAEFNKPEMSAAALSDLKRALQYPHPKPHIVYWIRFRILLLSCQSKDDVLQKEEAILQCLEQYFTISKKYYDEPVVRRNESLSVGRPKGIPFARFTDNNYDDFLTKYYGGRMSYFVAAEKWQDAKEASDKLIYLTTEPISYQRRILILTRLGDYEKLAALKKRILQECKASALTGKKDIPALKNLVLQIDRLIASQRRQ